MFRWLSRHAAAGLLALAVASPVSAWARGEAPHVPSEIFDDWTLVCDNGRRCTAAGLPTQAVRTGESELDGGGDALLMIVRDPQANAQARAEIVLPYWEGPGAGGRWTLTDTSGKPIAPALTALFIPSDHTLRIRLPSAAVDALLRAPREVTLTPASRKPVTVLSLVGLKPALIRLDAVQGRSGGVTAIVSKGPRPASAVPAPPPIPIVRKASRSRTAPPRLKPPQALIALSGQLSALEICSGMGNGVPAETVGTPYRLDDRTLLWTIWCEPGNNKGFNQTHIPVLSALDGAKLRFPAFGDSPPPATPRQIMRARPTDETDRPVPSLSGFTFYAFTGVVEQSDISSTLAEYSGRFDRYVWTGRRMVLVEASEVSVPSVGGSANAAPYFKVWPPYYRANVVPAKAARPAVRPAAPPR